MSLQWPFIGTFAIAAAGFALLGGRLLLGPTRRAGTPLLFTSLYLGQMLAWLASPLILPFNALLQRVTGHAVPLGLIFWAGVAVVWAKSARRVDEPALESWRGRLSRGMRSPLLLLWIAGIAGFAKVASVYSAHLGALGLDTHQHIYWANQIVDAGYVPLAVRHTDVLAGYPKGFHLLVALWSAAGLGGIAGPFVGVFVKVMPFVQSFLPALAFAELLVVAGMRSPSPSQANAAESEAQRGRAVVLVFVLASALLVYSFALTRMVYPEFDLNSTPRHASNGLLLLPFVCGCLGWGLDERRFRVLAWASLPAVAMLLVALNVVLVGQLFVFFLPLLLCCGVLLGVDLEAPRDRAEAIACVGSVLVVVAIALADPFVVSAWASRTGAFGEGYLAAMGIVSPDVLMRSGLLSNVDFVAPRAVELASGDSTSILGLALRSFGEGLLGWPAASGKHFPFTRDLFSDAGRQIYGVTLVALLGTAAVMARARTRARAAEAARFEGRLALAIAIAVALAGLLGAVASRFTEALAVGRSHAFTLLRDYTQASAAHVSLIALALLWLAMAALVLRLVRIPDQAIAVGSKPWGVAMAAVLLAVAPFWLYGFRNDADSAKGFWTHVGREDLRNLRRIEEQIADWEVVMVPAETWKIGEERWIIPKGGSASVLPFAEKRFLFNVRLGHGVRLGWRDLTAFCTADLAQQRRFLREQGVAWIFLKARESGTRDFYERFRLCGRSLEALGAGHPPAHQFGDQSLYRVDGRTR